MKAGGKKSIQLAGSLDYVGNSREMEELASVPIGSPVEQNETAWLSHVH
jgi:hypothetical protein